MTRTVVVIGSFNVDHVWTLDALPAPGETRAGRYASGPGGKGFNQAVAAARAGADVAFVCALGDDAGGQLARVLAAADGIDMRDAASREPTGTAGIFVDASGRNSIVVAAGANADVSPAHLDANADALRDAAVVLVQLETPLATALDALRLARANGAIAMLNPAPANVAPDAALLAAVDILTPNETEFAALMASHVGIALDGDAIAAVDDAALHAHCRRLLPRGTVALTLGAAGVFVSHADHALRGDATSHVRLRAPTVTPIDTTGAGDAFNGALAASLATDANAPFARHAVFAVRYASASTLRAGAALAMPAHTDLDALLAH